MIGLHPSPEQFVANMRAAAAQDWDKWRDDCHKAVTNQDRDELGKMGFDPTRYSISRVKASGFVQYQKKPDGSYIMLDASGVFLVPLDQTP